MLRLASWALLVSWTGLVGCTEERPRFRGEGCDLNTECDAPLVCGFRRCRIECRSEIDCGLGLGCFIDSRSGLGYCQLPDELECLLDSDCEEACGGDSECRDQLACRDGECGQECLEDRDCAEGATCTESGGVHTCEPTNEELCVYNSDCADPTHICDPRQVCRIECRIGMDAERDCEPPRRCAMVDVYVEETMMTVSAPRCVLPDGGM